MSETVKKESKSTYKPLKTFTNEERASLTQYSIATHKETGARSLFVKNVSSFGSTFMSIPLTELSEIVPLIK